jgi:hypothetical protein
MKKYITSSENSQDISMTLKGIVTLFIPLIILIAKKYNVFTNETDVMEIINIVTTIAGSMQIFYGGTRRIKNIANKNKNSNL